MSVWDQFANELQPHDDDTNLQRRLREAAGIEMSRGNAVMSALLIEAVVTLGNARQAIQQAPKGPVRSASEAGAVVATTIPWQLLDQWVALVRVQDPMADDGPRRCRVCGCTDQKACPGGCWWVEPDLCSACQGEKTA